MNDSWIQKAKSKTLQKRLYTDVEKGIFTDVVFRIGPDGNQCTFKAHLLVLASENSELEKMFQKSDVSRIIYIPDVHPKGFENLIRYCYGEKFKDKDLESIRETYLVAEKFKIKKLMENTEDYLIDLLKAESLIKILCLCLELNISRSKERCLNEISSRYEGVLKTEELISAPQEVLEQILSLCPDRGLYFKISAVCTVLAWAEQHECPSIVTRHLISITGYDSFPRDVIMSLHKEKGVQFTESWLREGSFSKVVSSLESFLSKSPNVGKNTTESLLEEFKSESSDVPHENSFTEEEIFKDEEEIGEETREQGDEKMSDVGYDSDDCLVIEKVKKDLIRETSFLIKSAVACSARDTSKKITNIAEALIKHAAKNMQKVFDEMEDSFQYITACEKNTSKNRLVR